MYLQCHILASMLLKCTFFDYRKPLRHTLLVFLRTQTCVPSTLSGSPSCLRISSWLGESVGSAPNLFTLSLHQTAKRDVSVFLSYIISVLPNILLFCFFVTCLVLFHKHDLFFIMVIVVNLSWKIKNHNQ